MLTIDYEELKALRTDPRKFFNKTAITKDNIFQQLVKTMTFSPELFDDLYILNIVRPSKAGAIMQECLASMIDDFFNVNIIDEISHVTLKILTNQAREREGLPDDFEPDEELLEYGRKLRIAEQRIQISKEDLEKAKNVAKIVHENLRIPTKKANIFKDYKFTNPFEEEPFKIDTVADPYWIDVFSTYRCAKSISLASEFDIVKIGKEIVKSTNIFYFEDIHKFPQYYKDNRLDYLVGIQKYILEGLLKDTNRKDMKLEVNFAVLNEELFYLFHTKLDSEVFIEELDKALDIIVNNSKLPAEFLRERITL